MDAILILKHMHEDVKSELDELLHTDNPFQAQEFWRELQPPLNRQAETE